MSWAKLDPCRNLFRAARVATRLGPAPKELATRRLKDRARESDSPGPASSDSSLEPSSALLPI